MPFEALSKYCHISLGSSDIFHLESLLDKIQRMGPGFNFFWKSPFSIKDTQRDYEFCCSGRYCKSGLACPSRNPKALSVQ